MRLDEPGAVQGEGGDVRIRSSAVVRSLASTPLGIVVSSPSSTLIAPIVLTGMLLTDAASSIAPVLPTLPIVWCGAWRGAGDAGAVMNLWEARGKGCFAFWSPPVRFPGYVYNLCVKYGG